MIATFISSSGRLAELAVTQLWQLTLLALFVGAIVRIGCRRRPHLAYLLWMVVVVKCVTLPLWGSPTSLFSWLQRDVAAGQSPVAAPAESLPPPDQSWQNKALAKADENVDQPTSDIRASKVADTTPGLAAAITESLLALWLLGSIAVAGWIAFKRRGLQRLIRHSSSPAPGRLLEQLDNLKSRLGVRRNVRIVVIREQCCPAVFGTFRPTILLPAALAESAGADIIEPILAHELIHVRRGDTAASLLQLVAQTLWWFHPLVWWANREARREREWACDEEVVAGLEYSPTQYARMLLDLLESLPINRRIVAPTGVAMLSFTARRLDHLVRGPSRFHRRTPRGYWLMAVIALALVLPGAALSSKPDAVVAAADQPRKQDEKKSVKEPSEKNPRVTGTLRLSNDTGESDSPPDVPRPTELPLATDADTEAHRHAIAEIKRLGGYPSRQRQPDGKTIVSVSIPETISKPDECLSYLKDLTGLTTAVISCEKVSADSLAKLKAISSLEMLVLHQVTDEQLAGLRGFAGVTQLQLISEKLSNAAMEIAGSMPKLTSIIFVNARGQNQKVPNPVTDAGLAPLKNLKELRRLSLVNCPGIHGTGLSALAELPNLDELWLQLIPLDADGLAAMASLSHLKLLSFTALGVSSKDYAPLEKMTSLENLSIGGGLFDDAAAAYLTKLTKLRVLGLSDVKISDDALAHVGKLDQLRSLSIWKAPITDAGLAHLKDLRELRSLFLTSRSADLEIGDEGLKNLSGMTHLRSLTLDSKRITDSDLASLAGLKNLSSLKLRGSQIHGMGLQHLTGLPKLNELDLSQTPLTDDGVSQLSKLTSLTSLNLQNTLVTDAALEKLASLKNLRSLLLDGTKVTKAGQERLKKLLPKVEFIEPNTFMLCADNADSETDEPAKKTADAQPAVNSRESKPQVTGTYTGTTTLTLSNDGGDDSKTGTATGTVAPLFPTIMPPAATEADTKAHQEAVAEIQKLHGEVYRQKQPDGKPVVTVILADGVTDGDKCLSLLKDLTGLSMIMVMGDKVSAEGLAQIKQLKSLEKIVLTQVTDAQVVALGGWDGIKNMQLQSNLISNSAVNAVATMPTLDTVLIANSISPKSEPKNPVTDEGIAALKTLTNLKSLSLIACPKVTGSGLKSLAGLKDFRLLQIGGLIAPPTDDIGFAAIATLPHITELGIDAGNVTSKGFQPLSKMTSLTRLTISNGKQFDDAAATSLAKLSKLQNLILVDTNLTDDGLAHFAGLSNLRLLHFGNGGAFTDRGLQHLKNLRDLRHLAIASRQPRQQSIDIGNEGLANLAGLTQLRSLSLPGKRITDDGLASLANSTELISLDLDYALIRGTGLKQLKNLKKLTSLSLGNSKLTDAELHWLTQFPELASLNLWATRVSDAGIEQLGDLKNLRSLQVDGTSVTKAGKNRLKKVLPQLQFGSSNTWTQSSE